MSDKKTKTPTPWEALDINASLPAVGIVLPTKFEIAKGGQEIATFRNAVDRDIAVEAVNGGVPG